jgi:hypothetical protein
MDCGIWQGLVASPPRRRAGQRPAQDEGGPGGRRPSIVHEQTYALLQRLAAAGDAGLPLRGLSTRPDIGDLSSQRSAMCRISRLLPAGLIKRLGRGRYAIAPGGLLAIARRDEMERAR